MSEMLIGRYRTDTKGKYTSVNQLGKSVTDYALMSEGILRNFVDFRTGTEIITISSHKPLTVTIRNVADELGKNAAETNTGLMRNAWKVKGNQGKL
jgi:hypothetical protein